MGNRKRVTALFMGLGSIGARRLGHLAELCAEQGLLPDVTALRATPRPLGDAAALVNREVRDAALLAESCFDLAFITGPTHLHAQAIAGLKGRVGAFFIEKPIFERLGYDLDALGLGAGQKAWVAAPMRHTALYAALKAALARRRPYSARVICSSYLPGWRPRADYRGVYSARREMGGGAALDLVHEWDYLTGLFGFPQSLCAMRGHYSHLEINSDDLAIYIADYKELLCELHLDYFGRKYRRSAEFFCREGSLLADWGTGQLYMPDGSVQNCVQPPYGGHRRELACFLDYALCAQAGESPSSPAHAQKILELALGEWKCRKESSSPSAGGRAVRDSGIKT